MPKYKLVVFEDKNDDGNFQPIHEHEWVGEAPAPTPSYTLVNAQVISATLNIRTEPNTIKPRDGYLTHGQYIKVYKERVDNAMLNYLADTYGDESYRSMAIDDNYVWHYSPIVNRFVAGNSASETYLNLDADASGTNMVRGHTLQLKGNIQLEEDGYNMRLSGFTGLGANLREGIHHHDVALVEKNLREMKRIGVKHIRMYVHRAGAGWTTIMSRVKHFADFTRDIGLGLCAVFDDSLKDSGHYYDGFDEYHTGPQGHMNISWYTDKAYKDAEYVLRLSELAALLSGYNHCVLDLMNEGAIVQPAGINQENFNAWLACWQYLSEVAWTAAGGKVPILTGTISVNYWEDAVHQFMANTPHIACASIHIYNHYSAPPHVFEHEEMATLDAVVAPRYGKAVYLGETGVHENNDNRSGRWYDMFRRFVQTHDISSVAYWNMQPIGEDVNMCDAYCISRFRKDYEAMINLWPMTEAWFSSKRWISVDFI